MLALIFRGVFLIGILGWYSASVWKMIDGYFKDQFQNYLQEEYRKNPRMKSDLAESASIDKKVAEPAPSVASAMQERVDVVTDAMIERAVGKTDEPTSMLNESSAVEEKEDELVDNKTAFPEDAEKSRKSSETLAEPIDKSANNFSTKDDGDTGHVEKPIVRDDRRTGKDGRVSGREKRANSPTASTPHRKRRAKTIVFTESDFESAKKRRKNYRSRSNKDDNVDDDDDDDEDFWKFEEDDDDERWSRGSLEGVPVSELPFKPRLDIGDLERVTADEFCPLTLEEANSCGETTKWP